MIGKSYRTYCITLQHNNKHVHKNLILEIEYATVHILHIQYFLPTIEEAHVMIFF